MEKRGSPEADISPNGDLLLHEFPIVTICLKASQTSRYSLTSEV